MKRKWGPEVLSFATDGVWSVCIHSNSRNSEAGKGQESLINDIFVVCINLCPEWPKLRQEVRFTIFIFIIFSTAFKVPNKKEYFWNVFFLLHLLLLIIMKDKIWDARCCNIVNLCIMFLYVLYYVFIICFILNIINYKSGGRIWVASSDPTMFCIISS